VYEGLAMRISTFNVDSLDMGPDAPVPLDERIPILRPQLERMRGDIVCLQEINGQHGPGHGPRTLLALDRLLEGTRYQTYARAMTATPGRPGAADVHNLVTLSRWPIKDFRSIRNAFVPPLQYRALTSVPPQLQPQEVTFERPVLVTDLEIGTGRTITVINVHFRAPLAAPIAGQKESSFVWKSVAGWAEGYALAAWKRTMQALEVRLLIDSLIEADPARLIAVAGDFNAEDHETPLKILVGAEEDTGNGLLAQHALVVLDRGLPADRRFSTLHHGRALMLDHILATRSLLAVLRDIEIHNEALSDEIISFGKARQEAGSFHAPLVADFDLG
jgi:endonuclease/exonuclease/phosphatase family metal-dependent hydrolase